MRQNSTNHNDYSCVSTKMIPILVFAALIITVNAGITNYERSSKRRSSRIAGGENALIETYPYQVSVQQDGFHKCGGSIISEEYVLTAAQCVQGAVESYSVRAGSPLMGEGGKVYEVAKIVLHEKYNVSAEAIPFNDVALIRLKELFKFDDTRKPVILFEIGEGAAPDTKSVVTGWGNTGNNWPIQLQTVTLPIVSKDVCNTAYKNYGGLQKGQICAGFVKTDAKGICKGDTGGPLTINGRLAGIISWGIGCTDANYPGLYTEIAYFREWINEHAAFSTSSPNEPFESTTDRPKSRHIKNDNKTH